MKILAIHSYAIYGTASLKAFMSILGSEVLPVPSLMLTGLTNIEGVRKFHPAFKELLMGTLEIVKQRNEKVLLYVGYLGNVSQVDIIMQAIQLYRSHIASIVVDPVSGDHGRLYVPEDILAAWPTLLAQADWALPNRTEARWLCQVHDESSAEQLMSAFAHRYPNLSFIITSLESHKELVLGLYQQGTLTYISHKQIAHYFGGTGDVFAAHFIREHWQLGFDAYKSVHKAAYATLACMEESAARGESFLWIQPQA